MIIKVNLGERTYPIIIQSELLNKIGTVIKRHIVTAPRCAVITDKNVAPLYLKKIITSLNSAGIKSVYKILPAGEKQKSLETVNKIYDFLIRNRIERNDAIIALGGGVIGDIAGFVAGTYKRGMKLIQAPTTLLAQVDSSIGGKTGVNLDSGKNLVGVFHQPSAVLIDPLALKTLSKREFANGMAEVIKASIIKDVRLFRLLSDKHNQITELNPPVLEEMLARAIRVKKYLVEQDEFDTKGRRALLNYGHTIGHILEASGKYRCYRHGQAVAIGMMSAARLAYRTGLVKDDFVSRQEEILKMYKLPIAPNRPIRFSQAIKFLEQDKKAVKGKIIEILPNRIGSAKVYRIPLGKFK